MKKMVLITLLLWVIVFPASAEEGYPTDFLDSVEIEDGLLSDETDLQDHNALQKELSIDHILEYLRKLLHKTIASAGKILLPGMSMILLSVWVNYCCQSFSGDGIKTAFSLVLTLSMTLIGQRGLKNAVEVLGKALENMKIFCTACIPSFSVVLISAGENGGAAVFSSLMILLGEVGVFVSSHLLMPLVHIYLSIGACAAVGDEYNFSAVAQYIRRFAIWAIGLAVAGFRLILKLQVGAATAGDLVAKKYIKSAVAGLIPFVGGSLSQGVDGLFAVASGAKGTFAVAGVLTLISVMLPSLLTVGLYGLCWSICRWVAGFLNDRSAGKMADVLANGYYLLLALGGGITMMGLFSFFGLISWVA